MLIYTFNTTESGSSHLSMRKLCNEMAALKAVQENIMSHSHYEQKSTFLKTHYEYIWAVSRVSMTREETAWFSKATLSEKARLSKGKVARPVTCWLVGMHLNGSAHLTSHQVHVCETNWQPSCILKRASYSLHPPWRTVLCMQRVTVSFPWCHWRTKINTLTRCIFPANVKQDRHAERRLAAFYFYNLLLWY